MSKKIISLLLCAVLLTAMLPMRSHAVEYVVNMADMLVEDSNRMTLPSGSVQDSFGNTYAGNIVMLNGEYEGYVRYRLDGWYTAFVADLVCSNDAYSSSTVNIAIFADGELLYHYRDFNRRKTSQHIALDVSGVRELVIATQSDSGNNGDIYFVNGTFTKSVVQTQYPTHHTLLNLYRVDGRNDSLWSTMGYDTFGNPYVDYMMLTAYSWSSSYNVKNLNRQYEKLTCTIVCGLDTYSSSSATLEIYLDDELVYTQTGITRTAGAKTISLDVKDKTLIEFAVSANDNAHVLIVNSQLTPGYDPAPPAPTSVPMYRLYNMYTLEHLFLTDAEERTALIRSGWTDEGIGWNAAISGDPVYRLYNPDDFHFYSKSWSEVEHLLTLGWSLDGAVTCDAGSSGVPIYRLFNPYEAKNYHHYTTGEDEVAHLVSLGWVLEGVAWYAAE